MGVTSNVYLGIHKKTMVSVAIKLLRKECDSGIHRQMFRIEASLCGRMNHPTMMRDSRNPIVCSGAYGVQSPLDHS